jgi:hypothetical protein
MKDDGRWETRLMWMVLAFAVAMLALLTLYAPVARALTSP